MIYRIKRDFAVALIILLLSLVAEAAWVGNTYTVESPYAAADVQAGVDTANSKTGDVIIQIPDSSATWTTTVSVDMSSGWGTVNSLVIRGQNDATLDGNGRPTACGTNITNGAFNYKGLDGKAFRLAHLRLTGTSVSSNAIVISGTGKSWRFDHIFFDTLTASNRIIYITDKGTEVTYGLFDHLTITSPSTNFIHYQPDANLGGGNYGWMRSLDLGGPDAIYLEDSTYTRSSYNAGIAITDSNGSGRFVVRHCNITWGWIQAHDAIVGNFRGVRKWEIYNNTFAFLDGNNYIAMQPRGGTGVIFNNTITGLGSIILDLYRYDQTGGDPWDVLVSATSGKATLAQTSASLVGSTTENGSIEIDTPAGSPAGYPARDQAGTDGNDPQVSRPFLFWNNTRNGSAITSINTGRAPAYIVENRDYAIDATTMPASCNGVTTTYTPYTYPHPLQGGGGGGGGSSTGSRKVGRGHGSLGGRAP